MDTGTEIIEALRQIEKEKGISSDIIFEAIETSLVTAYKNNFENNCIIIDIHSYICYNME